MATKFPQTIHPENTKRLAIATEAVTIPLKSPIVEPAAPTSAIQTMATNIQRCVDETAESMVLDEEADKIHEMNSNMWDYEPDPYDFQDDFDDWICRRY